MVLSIHAQTIFYQNFQGTKNVKPAGWYQNSGANGMWQFNNTYGTNMNGYVPTHTYCAFVDDWDNNAGQAAYTDSLMTPVMNCSASPKVFLSLSYMFWIDQGSETGTIAISTDNGSTWTTAINLPNTNGGWMDSAMYDISAWAGGQANVKLCFTYFNGYPGGTYVAVGTGVDNIDVYAPPAYDMATVSQNQTYLLQVGSPYTLSGTTNNLGSTAITNLTMNYRVNGGPIQSQVMSSISVNPLTAYNWTMNTKPFTPGAVGNYTVKFWADNLNVSNADMNNKNDTFAVTFMAIDTVAKKIPMFEEVVGQSCYYCMLASPNVDSVEANNAGNVNVIHYHVPYPGPPDYMYSENVGIGSAMISYYSVGGTPQGELDGSDLYPGALGAPNDFSTPLVSQAAAAGSPFKINISNCTYNSATKKYSATVTIKSFGNFAAGLVAKAAITNDLITYGQDYSADDPPSTFAPPDGTMVGGTSDYYWQFVTIFPSVVEAMMPNTNGTALAAFTPNSTQTLNLSWTKNHAWSLSGASYPYDSSATDHLTVFIQTNAGIPAVSIPAKYVFQSASSQFYVTTGMEELGNGVSFEMYPNPTSKLTNLTYNLDQSQDVNVQVYNMLGENVYSVDNGRMGAGQHTMSIDCSGLQSGVYFVRFNADNATTTKRLVIQQ